MSETDYRTHLQYVKKLAGRVLNIKREGYEKISLSKDRQFERMYAAAQIKSADAMIGKRIAPEDGVARAGAKYDEMYEKHLTSNKEHEELVEKSLPEEFRSGGMKYSRRFRAAKQ